MIVIINSKKHYDFLKNKNFKAQTKKKIANFQFYK